MDYPVLEIAGKVKEALDANPVVIVQAPPGAGKSTVLSLELLKATWLLDQKIVMLEPRRLAAKSVATRMAQLLDDEVGNKVGYRIRFESKAGRTTQVEVVTEGILTRMIQSDASLPGVGLLIFDEFHERSLNADLSLALTLQAQQILRPDLKVLIMSATMDTARLSAVLGNAPVIVSLGRQFPVEVKYFQTDAQSTTITKVTRAIRQALKEETGDILAFLPGAGEILGTKEQLEQGGVGAAIHVLYGDLPMKQQQLAITPDPGGIRKIVLSSSIAETSLTIEGIRVVVDSGLSRVSRFDVRSGLSRLETVKVTRDAADQRAGRAGRLGPGVCYRLWHEATHQQLAPTRVPEILEADLAPLLLELSQWGVTDVNQLTWITPPPPGAIAQAGSLLTQLGAMSDDRITERGREMVALPCHPRIAHMLIEAKHESEKITALACDVAALLEERDPIRDSGADISLRVELLRKYRGGERVNADRGILDRIERLAASWRRTMRVPEDNSTMADDDTGSLVAAAYPERIARQEGKHSERYKLFNGRVAKLPANDALTRERWLAIAHLDSGAGEGRIFLAAPLAEADIMLKAKEERIIRWDEEREMVIGVSEKKFGALVITSTVFQIDDNEKKVRILCDVIREKGLSLIGWGEEQERWQARVCSVRAWRGNEWPDVNDSALLQSVSEWLGPFLHNAYRRSDLNKLDLQSICNSILPWELQQQLDRFVPARIEVPSGSMIRINYTKDGQAPQMEVRLQEMFGLVDTPAVNEGKVRIILHLLSPGYKPVQVTQDMRSFWTNTYHEIRKELRMRYPRHSWPEDPFTAKAVRGVKRKS
jgi:ATP-dependent helicase HrpB